MSEGKKTLLRMNGPVSKLKGSVLLSGAKNSALKLMVGAILVDDAVILENVPVKLNDIKAQLELMSNVGIRFKQDKDRCTLESVNIPQSLDLRTENSIYRTPRTSILLMAALLSRVSSVEVPFPGGDKLGKRPIDLHIYALEKLGIECEVTEGSIMGRRNRKPMEDVEIVFPLRSTGATETAIIASVLLEGRRVTLINAYTRPEVEDLINFLNKAGADIEIVGSGVIKINGVKRLAGRGLSYRVMPDAVEAMTFLAAAALTKSPIEIKEFPFDSLVIPMAILEDSGVMIRRDGTNAIYVPNDRVTAFEVYTGVYPEVNTDYQPILTVLALGALGTSRIVETQFDERFHHVKELNKMGAGIKLSEHIMLIDGPKHLQGARVFINDIRAGGALVIAGLITEGELIMENVYELDRGYELIDEKLKGLGVDIERINE